MFVMFGNYHIRADRVIAVRLNSHHCITVYTDDDKEYNWICYSETDAKEKRAIFLRDLNKALKKT